LADGRLVKEVVADADGADDVDREERHPTQQKHTCKKIAGKDESRDPIRSQKRAQQRRNTPVKTTFV